MDITKTSMLFDSALVADGFRAGSAAATDPDSLARAGDTDAVIDLFDIRCFLDSLGVQPTSSVIPDVDAATHEQELSRTSGPTLRELPPRVGEAGAIQTLHTPWVHASELLDVLCETKSVEIGASKRAIPGV